MALTQFTAGLLLPLNRTNSDSKDFQAPEMQTMYNLPMPVANIRTRIRQEFERHRYVAKLPVADVLLFKSHAEYQVQTLKDCELESRGTTTANPT